MAVSYNGLWKLLIDKGMKKMDLVENERIGISSSTLANWNLGFQFSQNRKTKSLQFTNNVTNVKKIKLINH